MPAPRSTQTSGQSPNGNVFADTQVDTLMPHPTYAPQSWVCVLNPSDETFVKVQTLLTEGHAMAMERHRHRLAKEAS